MAVMSFLVVSVLSSVLLCESYDVKLSQVYFDGGFLFFPVKRETLQQRLDEINTHFDNDVRLYLPSPPVLQDIISSDEHVVTVGFGNMTAIAFEDALTNEEKENVSTVLAVIGSMIPYLTSEEGGSAVVTFQETLFTAGENYIKVNLVLPPGVVADKLVRIEDDNKNEIIFEKDDLLFHATGKQQGSCEQLCQHVIDDVEELENERQISTSGPDFSVCDRFPDLDVDFCNVYRNPFYNQLLKEAGTNVCIHWKPTNDVKNCKSNFQVEEISQQMRDLLLLDNTTNVIEADIQKGTYDIRLVFPCIQ
ncbi:hypothetical protein HOLleu_00404 [Holothuria leucospilota]|uniref:Uncharacterized protein n=1 Tax=Holothuria leucospilota TaxID=206669 RepID=A0A9Q1HKA8_HOLLE|nr:hypothetical protein HOLleu_00404 [Holothuria leucospilota]